MYSAFGVEHGHSAGASSVSKAFGNVAGKTAGALKRVDQGKQQFPRTAAIGNRAAKGMPTLGGRFPKRFGGQPTHSAAVRADLGRR